MKTTLKRALSGLLCLVLLLMSVPANVSATAERELIATKIYAPQINPLYKDVIKHRELAPVVNAPAVEADNVIYHTSVTDAGAYFRDCMKNRKSSFVIGIRDDFYSDAQADQYYEQLWELALMHTGVPQEGDSLKWQWQEYAPWLRVEWDVDAETGEDVYYYLFSYEFIYYTTAQQEAVLTTAVNSLLNQLNVYNADDYVKVCAIYDYLCDNITYDHNNLYDDSYKLKYTPYAGLINKTCVCQGYALLFYRLALELDVDARLIAGIGGGGAHGWNIVKLGDKYYNLDSTWDAGSYQYMYFLRSPSTFYDHYRWDEYDTPSFHAAYPMSDTDYNNRCAHSWIAADCLNPKTCAICGETQGVALGHTEVIDTGYAATCITTGLSEGKHCAVCKLVLEPQVTIEKLPHTFTNDEDASCNICGYTRQLTPITDTMPVYRLYNPYTLEHLFTGGAAEKDALAAAGWIYEGVAWYAPKSGNPVYRLYNPYTNGHFYTADAAEKDACVTAGWYYDGVVSYAVTADTAGAIPVFRLFNPYETTNYHHYTAGVEERDFLKSLGWIYEGIAWFALAK